jgi:hydrogenase maturation protease
VRVFVDEDMDRMLGGHGRSIHEVGLMDLMNMARLTERLPQRRALVGIQPAIVDWGTEPSPAWRGDAEAARAVAALIEEWTGTEIDGRLSRFGCVNCVLLGPAGPNRLP